MLILEEAMAMVGHFTQKSDYYNMIVSRHGEVIGEIHFNSEKGQIQFWDTPSSKVPSSIKYLNYTWVNNPGTVFIEKKNINPWYILEEALNMPKDNWILRYKYKITKD